MNNYEERGINIMSQYLTANELAELLQVTRCTVYNWVRKGILPCGFKIGKCRRWDYSEIENSIKIMKGELY